MNAKALLNGLLVCFLLVEGSCVSPGDFDQSVLVRYQEAMANRGPQPRQSAHGLGFLEPSPGATGPKLKVVKDASGKSVIYLSLDEAVMRCLANSLDIQVVSFDPEINRDLMIEAAAAFDYIVFGSVGWTKQDTPANVFTPNENYNTLPVQAGIKTTTITGATVSVAPTLTRIVDDSNNKSSFPNAYTSSLQIQISQPLLQNAWPEFNLAKLHIAQLTYKNSLAQFRQKVEETINNVIDDYWLLMQARRNVEIEQQLLDKTIETRERIRQRMDIDATYVDLKQAEAAVETRRAVLISDTKNIGDAQDQLARLLADAQINALSPYEIIPSTPAQEVQLKVDAADQLVEALLHNPVLEQARIAIAASDVNIKIAQNQTLPNLTFQGTANILGQNLTGGDATTEMLGQNPNYSSFNIGLLAQYPLGNRAALAELEKQKFTKLQNIVTLQNTADQVAVQINERIRQINTTFQVLLAQRFAVTASVAQLQALNDIEQIRGKLTPEFVQLKLQAQETLADAQTGEVAALANYNIALADLSRIAGTILGQHGIDVLKMPASMGETRWPSEQSPSSKPWKTGDMPNQ
jgi:outer membrane protein TolC